MRKTFIAMLFATVTAMSCAASTDKENEVYLRSSSGPYRGRVIDAKTKEPIAGAIVVAVWYRDVLGLGHSVETYYDAVEVVTDAQGYFVVDAPDIERRAPWRTKFPVFTVFKAGRRYFEGWLASLNDMSQRDKKSLLGLIELGPDPERRSTTFLPPARVPEDKIPKLMEALKRARSQGY